MKENKQDDLQEKKEVLSDIKKIKTQEKFTLPSKGLIYTQGENIPASITLRRMTTKEDKIRWRNMHEMEIQRDILQACILEQGIDVGRLKIPDANFLLFRLRQLSLLDDIYKVHCKCPYCGTEFVHEVDLNEIPIKYYNEELLKESTIELPMSHIKIELRYPNVNDIITVYNDFSEYIKAFPDSENTTDYLYDSINGLYIKSINTKILLKEEIPNFINNLDILDSRALLSRIDKLPNMFGFDEKITALCPNKECGKEIIHTLPITSELFTPSN